MNENKKEFRLDYGGKEVIVELGRLCKQADGAALVTCEGTQVLVTVCSAHEAKDGQDFFPLMVDYREKFYAAGRFLGGFMKREARPGTHETLNSRLIDRPIRPLFPEGYMTETVVMATVHSFEQAADPEVLAGLGTAAALAVSDIPFAGPLGTCKVGRINGEFVLNPAYDQWAESDIELTVAASRDALMMVEGEADECSEEDILKALSFAHTEIKKYCELVDTMVKECGRTKREFVSTVPNATLMNQVKEDYSSNVRECLNISAKLDRYAAVKKVDAKVKEAIAANPTAFGMTEADASDFGKEAHKAVDELLYHMTRNDIVSEDKRIGPRGLNEVRQVETEIDVFKNVHGSSLFTRGETQVMATVTLGGEEGNQTSDRLSGREAQNFYLHYTFAPYCVGEARGYRGVGRRELGHGNLAERALKKVITDECKYTVRVCCEVLESNGSSSMGSVCSGSMALMDAGIPMTGPVAGVAMGLVKEGDSFKILTDILGDEDHLGDMDFKVAGTAKGITAIQMDIKIEGITEEIYTQALNQAKDGRLHILGEMAKSISTPRAELKKGVPRIESLMINKDSIGALIGPGGKNIKKLQETFDVSISIDESGEVKIVGSDGDRLATCKDVINLQINGPEVGSVYDSVVVTIKEYGAFVDIAEGVSGLVHISEIADARVKDVSDYLDEGDKVKVKILEMDRFGRAKMSIKAVAPVPPKPGREPAKGDDSSDGNSERPRRDRNDRPRRDRNDKPNDKNNKKD